MHLGRPPNYGSLRSLGLWHLVYPEVRALTVRGDATGSFGCSTLPTDHRIRIAWVSVDGRRRAGSMKAEVAIDRLANSCLPMSSCGCAFVLRMHCAE